MKNNRPTISGIVTGTLVAVLPTNYASAGSHELEISLQNCYYAKIFAKTVIEKRKASRPKAYYEQISFTSPIAMEIVLGAYETDAKEPNFSDKWFEECKEISCSAFWADLKVAIELISD